jgi:hypothetical protein
MVSSSSSVTTAAAAAMNNNNITEGVGGGINGLAYRCGSSGSGLVQ